MEALEQDPGDAFSRGAGAALIGEAILLAATRLFTLVYVVAREVDIPDKHRTQGSRYLVFSAMSIALVVALAWAGAQMRRTPSGAWRAAGIRGRADLVVAGILNVGLATWAIAHLFSQTSKTGSATVAWILAAALALGIAAGLLRDAAGRARPTVER